MILALSACHKDIDACQRLIEWCHDLQPDYHGHTALIVMSSLITDVQQKTLIQSLNECRFDGVHAIRQRERYEVGWPGSCNRMFAMAAEYVENVLRGPFMWLESDATPLKPRWLDMLEAEYKIASRPYMGVIFDWVSATRKLPHVTGTAIYPAVVKRHNPYSLTATEIPWDCTRPELTIANLHKTNLIFHSPGPDLSAPKGWTFPNQDALKMIPREAVVFHSCKDGSLIHRLREQQCKISPAAAIARKSRLGLRSLFGFKPEPTYKISVRRSGAYGDALAATCVANKLSEQNIGVEFQTTEPVRKLLSYCPGLKVTEAIGKVDVNLDGCYENDPNRRSKHFADMFIASANAQMPRVFSQLEARNIAPVLTVPERIKRRFNARFSHIRRPWIGICPRSNSFNVRTVPDSTWAKINYMVQGSLFWLGNHAPPPHGFVGIELNDITNVLFAIACMDLFVGVDSGPMHIAAALGIPAIAIEQSSSPELHLSDQRDFLVIKPEGLTCLNCQQHRCPLDAAHPPCQDISPYAIATAVNRRLDGMKSDDVSAVMPIYRPSAQRLNRAIGAVLPQVSEVIVCADQHGVIPRGTIQHPKVRYVTSRQNNIGYGRKLNFGVRHSVSKWILAVNDDVFLDPDAVEKLLEIMRSDDKIGAVGHLLWYPGRKQVQHGGTARNNGDCGWGHIDHRKTTATIQTVVEQENVTGASVLIRRKAFYDILGMDERYFLYYEDNDFCLRLRRNGWKVFYTPFAVGDHEEHSSTGHDPSIAPEFKRTRDLFKATWQPYFDHNKDRKLGNFDYV